MDRPVKPEPQVHGYLAPPVEPRRGRQLVNAARGLERLRQDLGPDLIDDGPHLLFGRDALAESILRDLVEVEGKPATPDRVMLPVGLRAVCVQVLPPVDDRPRADVLSRLAPDDAGLRVASQLLYQELDVVKKNIGTLSRQISDPVNLKTKKPWLVRSRSRLLSRAACSFVRS